jgi:hypothetical protein
MSIPEPLRQRVDDVLWAELGVVASRTGPRPTSTFGTTRSGAEPPTGYAAIDAFEGIGLLDPGLAAHWRGLFAAAAAAGPGARPEAELRARVHAYLAELIREGRDAHRRGDGFGAAPTAVLNDLRQLGLLDEEDVRWWFELLLSGVADEAQPEPTPLERLERRIPGPPERRRGSRVVAVDLFDHGVVVRVHQARAGRDMDVLPDEQEPDARPCSMFEPILLEDDVGTIYRLLGGGAGGSGSRNSDGPGVSACIGAFAPRVPDAARHLVILVGEARFEVAL